MSIFKRRDPDNVPQPGAASPEPIGEQGVPQPPAPFAPAGAPGVVPPAAAPMYSTRAPEQAGRVDDDVQSNVAEKVRAARETQLRAKATVRDRARAIVQRAKSASPAGYDRRRFMEQGTAVPAPSYPPNRQIYDPVACAQTGLLNLAWRWQEAGAPIRAIHAYIELLCRYPGTAAADAAVSDLVDLSEKLAQQGQFHTALAIYDHLEHLA